MIGDIFQFITSHWEKIVLVATTLWTLYQEFRIQVLKKPR